MNAGTIVATSVAEAVAYFGKIAGMAQCQETSFNGIYWWLQNNRQPNVGGYFGGSFVAISHWVDAQSHVCLTVTDMGEATIQWHNPTRDLPRDYEGGVKSLIPGPWDNRLPLN